MKNSGGGMRAMGRQGGTAGLVYGVKRHRCCKYYNGTGEFQGCWWVAIKGAIEGSGSAMSKRERLRRAKKKNSVYPIGEEKVSVLKNSVQKSQKFGLIKWAHDGTRIHVGMSKRWTCTTVRLEVGAPSRRCPE
jgi:hypothetical protein